MAKPAKIHIEVSLLVVFAVLAISGGLGNCSQSATNAMLVEITFDLGIPIAVGQWLTTSYILALGIAVPLSSYIFRRYSERYLVLLALAMCSVGSILMIFSGWFWMSVFARVMQACAIGLIMPTMQTMIMVDLPAERRGTFMGINGVAMGFMVNVGPTIGGIMTDAWGWRSFFWLVFAICVILMIPAAKCARSSAGNPDLPFDVLSFAMCSLAFVLLLLGVSDASSFGLAHPLTWGPIAVGMVLMALFVRKQRRMEHPLLSMDVFKDATFTTGFIIASLLFASFVGITLIIPLYVEELCGGTALDAGLVMLPAAAVALAGNLVAGVLVDHIGHRRVLVVSALFLLLGAWLCVMCGKDTPFWVLMVAQSIRTLGVSSTIGPIIGWTLGGLSPRMVSDASAVLTMDRQAMASLGTSVMVLIVTAVTNLGAAELSYHLAFGFSATLALIVFALIVWRVR